eukprot:Rhum_TRINITY_DN15618_c0_g10::Rhum_TRINITY_DN15618_c0_g10_i1::g.161705::m.161705
MGAQDEEVVRGVVISSEDTEPLVYATENPSQYVQAEVVEVVNPESYHFCPAFLSTFFCHILGLGCTLLCCPSSYGKAGASAGFAFSSLKFAVFGMAAACIVAHDHLPHAFYPDEHASNATDCTLHGGEWVMQSEAQSHMGIGYHRRETHLHSHAHAAVDTPTCMCPRLYLHSTEAATGRTVCVNSHRFWVKLAILSFVLFYMFTLVARHYLRRAQPTTEVTVLAPMEQTMEPTPVQAVVVGKAVPVAPETEEV